MKSESFNFFYIKNSATADEMIDFLFKSIQSVGEPRRKMLEEALQYFQEKTDFFVAPASSKYHHACVHGLLKHTCEVLTLGSLLAKNLQANVPSRQLVTTSIFHDVGKIGKYHEESVGWSISKDLSRLSDPMRSVIFASRFIKDISDEELFAITCHDGMYTEEGRLASGKESQLLLILHWADMWSARSDQFLWGDFRE